MDGNRPDYNVYSKRTRIKGVLNGLVQQYYSATESYTASASNLSREPGDITPTDSRSPPPQQVILFPTYGFRLTDTHDPPSSSTTIESLDQFPSDPESNDLNGQTAAVVTAEVKGWVWAPAQEPFSSTQRVFLNLLRQMGGISSSNSRFGGFSRTSTLYGDSTSQTSSITVEQGHAPPFRTHSSPELSERSSLDENDTFMQRIGPFLSSASFNVPLTVIFYNDENAESRNAITDQSGHFAVRASLPFSPSNVKVLVSDLAVRTIPLTIVDPIGVSVISDIDDTIKHTDVSGGSRQVIRNTFVNPMSSLAIPHVSEWYNQMKDFGATFHYVSNSPWQLYPVIEQFFQRLQFPRGSLHLKQYSNFFQSFLEAVADRKKSSLYQIARDFPLRKFILIGDSGEADLEVYVDFAIAFPSQVMAIFIRNVTTEYETFPATESASPSPKPGTCHACRYPEIQGRGPPSIKSDCDLRSTARRSAPASTIVGYNIDTESKCETPPPLPPRSSEQGNVRTPQKPMPPRKPHFLRHQASDLNRVGSNDAASDPESSSMSSTASPPVEPMQRHGSNLSSSICPSPPPVTDIKKAAPPPPPARRSNMYQHRGPESSSATSVYRQSSVHTCSVSVGPVAASRTTQFESVRVVNRSSAKKRTDWTMRWEIARATLDRRGLGHVKLISWKSPTEHVRNISCDLILGLQDEK